MMVLSILFNLLVGGKENLDEAPKEPYFIDYLCGHFRNDFYNGDLECFRIDLDILSVTAYFIPTEIKDNFLVPTLCKIFIEHNKTNCGTASATSSSSSPSPSMLPVAIVNDGSIMSSTTQALAALAAAGHNDRWFTGVPPLYEKVASLIVLNTTEKSNRAPLLRLCCHVCRISREACTIIAGSQLVPRALVLAFREFAEMISTQDDLAANIRDHGRTITSTICFLVNNAPGSFAVFEHFFAYVAASETVHPSVSAYAGFVCAALFKLKQ